MFERLSASVAARVRLLTGEQAQRIAAMLDAVPGVSAVRDGDRVVVEGPRLGRRMIENPRLRGGWR